MCGCSVDSSFVRCLIIAVPIDGGRDTLVILRVFRLYLCYNEARPTAHFVLRRLRHVDVYE
jgi:hypothetical protein